MTAVLAPIGVALLGCGVLIIFAALVMWCMAEDLWK
jgi:hypothetical protein